MDQMTHLPIGVLTLDPSQRIVGADARFCELFACSSEDVVGRAFDDLFSPRDRRAASAYYTRLSRYESGFIDVHLPIVINGKEFYTRARLKRLEREWLAYVENTLIEQDLTYQMVAAQERWLSVHLSLEDGIVVLDPDKRILEHNSAFVELLRFRSQHGIALSAQAIAGKPLFALLGAEKLLGLEEALEHAREDRQAVFHKVVEVGERSLDIKMRPLFLPVRGFIGSCIVVRDITQQRKLEQLRITQAQAHFAGMAELATNIVHNLGNICTNIIFSAEEILRTAQGSRVASLRKTSELLAGQEDVGRYLSEDPAGQKVPRYLGQLAERLERENAEVQAHTRELLSKIHLMKEVISSQQDYARGVEVSEQVDLREVVDDALRIQRPALERHDVEVTTDFAPAEPISGQRLKLLHVLINLLKNAKEAMLHLPPAERRIAVSVGTDPQQAVVLRVSDVGQGIPKAVQSRIFGHGFTTKETGHGFGLHFCATAVQEMGGHLGVESAGEGQGATFTILFPKGTRPTRQRAAR